ncbi:uncharacterized protein [Notamacropus eugenii]|uniref:uncharacterized protein n=1 Tax=Notamacropus eugenii TaxID=9315 RepID=UPI003B67B8E4
MEEAQQWGGWGGGLGRAPQPPQHRWRRLRSRAVSSRRRARPRAHVAGPYHNHPGSVPVRWGVGPRFPPSSVAAPGSGGRRTGRSPQAGVRPEAFPGLGAQAVTSKSWPRAVRSPAPEPLPSPESTLPSARAGKPRRLALTHLGRGAEKIQRRPRSAKLGAPLPQKPGGSQEARDAPRSTIRDPRRTSPAGGGGGGGGGGRGGGGRVSTRSEGVRPAIGVGPEMAAGPRARWAPSSRPRRKQRTPSPPRRRSLLRALLGILNLNGVSIVFAFLSRRPKARHETEPPAWGVSWTIKEVFPLCGIFTEGEELSWAKIC